MSKKIKGSEKFNQYYKEIYQERWEDLKNSLLSPKSHVALKNPYSDFDFSSLENLTINNDILDFYTSDKRFERPEVGANLLMNYYLMDYASLLVAKVANPKQGDDVLDLCAAPGGKAVAMGFLLGGEGSLVCNDKSNDRRGRLKKVISEYFPEEITKNILVTGHDSSKWCLYESSAYDKILLDAPCSSEKHVLESKKHLDQWTIKRTKKLAILQFSMLASALDVVRVGGEIVYSTCSISPFENDDVIQKLFDKRSGRFLVEKISIEEGEDTKFGKIILPDTCGFGPIYMCKIKRVN